MARKVKLDMTGVETFTLCEEGIHTAKITKIEEATTQSGDDMLKVVFEVIKGNSKGARVFDNFALIDKALWKFKMCLEAMGIKADGKIIVDLDKLVGRIVDIEVYHDEYNGKENAKILNYTPASAKVKSSDDEDEDEDEEMETFEPKSKAKKKPEPEPEDEEDEGEDEEEEDEEEEPPKKAEKKAPSKSKAKPEPKGKEKAKKPEPEEEWDDDDDEDWDED